ncbi:hypothetical protein [Rhizobium laguerreae]|uniref:hypothetical protein n=1 Tax=Rhizobium laguerreae TaxID=1076926 RepID=UPI0014415E84|nr:hypothetical protein [Rhizobium laguerreae]NKN13958.1 hypothetical protein [Rhizobium laguerreae]
MSHGRDDLPCVKKNKSRHVTVRYSAAFSRTSTAKDSPKPPGRTGTPPCRPRANRQSFDTRKDGKAIVPNVARLVEPFPVHTDGPATATPGELAPKFIEHHGMRSKAVLCVAIMMFTGFRVSDVSRLGPQHRRRDMFKLRLFKNCNRNPYDIEIAIYPILEAVLAMHKVTDLTYVATEFGKPFLATAVAHNEATDSMLERCSPGAMERPQNLYEKCRSRPSGRQTVARINWDGVGTKLLALTDEGDVANR